MPPQLRDTALVGRHTETSRKQIVVDHCPSFWPKKPLSSIIMPFSSHYYFQRCWCGYSHFSTMHAPHDQPIKQHLFRDIEGLGFAGMPQFAGCLGGGFFVFYILRLSLSGWAGCHFGLTGKPLLAFWLRRQLGAGAADHSALGFSETSTLVLVGSPATTSTLRCI